MRDKNVCVSCRHRSTKVCQQCENSGVEASAKSNRTAGIVALIIPLPPSQNHAYITTRQGKRIMTKEHREYKERMRAQLKGKIAKCLPKLTLLQLRFYWPDKRRRDYDNYEKITLDILKGLLVEDDSCWHIQEKVSITAGIDKDAPRVEVAWLP